MQIRKSKQPKIQQNKTTLVQLPLTTLGQETRRAYSTTLPSPHDACTPQLDTVNDNLEQARRHEMKWGVFLFVKKVENGGCFCKKMWTVPQRRVHYVQYQYFLFYILLICGGMSMHPTHPLPTGLSICIYIG